MQKARVAIFEVTRKEEAAFEANVPNIFRAFPEPVRPLSAPGIHPGRMGRDHGKSRRPGHSEDPAQSAETRLRDARDLDTDCGSSGSSGPTTGSIGSWRTLARESDVPTLALETVEEATRKIGDVPFDLAIDLVRIALATEPANSNTTER